MRACIDAERLAGHTGHDGGAANKARGNTDGRSDEWGEDGLHDGWEGKMRMIRSGSCEVRNEI